MGDIQRFSGRVIDLAERLSDVADAAEGKRRRRGRVMRQWLLLPAAGAGIYALARSDAFRDQAKDVVDEAKTRASELPDDLQRRVRATSTSARRSGNGGQSRRKPRSTRKPSSGRKTTAAR
jgi:hypothetical protein